MTTKQMLHELMRAPWFPIEISICQRGVVSRDFKSGDVIRPWPDITLRTGSLNHPGGCIGYRVEFGGRAVALISDTEHVEGELDPNVLALIEKADLVIYDATVYRRGDGSGSAASATRRGSKASGYARPPGPRRLALFHHDPFRTDAELAHIEAQAKQAFRGAFAARDGQSLTISPQAQGKAGVSYRLTAHAASNRPRSFPSGR